MTLQLLVGVVAVWVAAAAGLGLLLCRAIWWARGTDDEPVTVGATPAEDPPARGEVPLVLDLTTPMRGMPAPRAQSDGVPVSATPRRDA